MIKKFLTVLVLGLVVFAVSCTKDDELSDNEVALTGAVANKEVTSSSVIDVTAATDLVVSKVKFDETGKNFTATYDESKTVKFSLVVGDDDNTATVGNYTATVDGADYEAVVTLDSSDSSITSIVFTEIVDDGSDDTTTTTTTTTTTSTTSS